MNPTLAYAKLLHEHGVSTVPIPHGQKHPRIPWKRFQGEGATTQVLEELFAEETGIGVICGAVSGNLAVLDFDNTDAYRYWAKEWKEAAEALPTDVRGARYHVYLRLAEPVASGKLFIEGFDGPAGDLLGEGKLCVIPPTRHPSGDKRQWVKEPTFGFPVVTLDALGVVVRPEPKALYEPTRNHQQTGDRPGDLFNARANWADVLQPYGWKYAGRCGTYHGWRRPGKADGLSAATGLGASGQDLLYVFSSNAAPLEADRCYSKFSALAYLAYGGDFAATTKAVVAMGYGQPAEHHPPRDVGSDEVGGENLHHHHEPSYRDDESTDIEEELYGTFFKPLPEYLREAGDGEPDWVVEGLLPATYLVVVGGNSKAGKSTLLTALGLAVAKGEPFCGLATSGGSVLWCAYEESEQERAMVLREFGCEPSGFYVTHAKLLIDTAEGLAAIRYWVRRTQARLLVIDPLYGANQAESLTDGRTARRVLAGLKDLCRETGVCAVVLHHITKNTASGMVRERMADSNQILATASMDLLMEVTENGDGSRTVRLAGHGRGSFANQTWVLRSTAVAEWELTARGADAEVDAEYRDGQLLDAVRVAPEGLTAVQLAERTGINEGTVRNRLTVMTRDGRLVTVGKDGRANRYGPGAKSFTQTFTQDGGAATFETA